MQRTDGPDIVIVCDFCRRDWDGQEPMIEGHLGSVLCLRCLQQALAARAPGPGPYRCTMCIREQLPAALPRWAAPGHAESIICQDCIRQAATAFSRSPHTAWEWDGQG